jgi:hypothetical protein
MRWNRQDRPMSCEHRTEIRITSVGLERQVCEGCGRVRFRTDSRLSGPVDRGMFARPADEMQRALTVGRTVEAMA